MPINRYELRQIICRMSLAYLSYPFYGNIHALYLHDVFTSRSSVGNMIRMDNISFELTLEKNSCWVFDILVNDI